jgi:DUF971 family protein
MGMAKPIPNEIRSADGTIFIRWSDGHASRYPSRDLRLACRCAACVDEWTHENRIVTGSIPPTVKPTGIEVVGQYALHFTWSDGHNTGIYTYDYLREVCACDECRKPREFTV